MKKLVLSTLFICITVLFPFNVFSQAKFERELRIRKSKAPESSIKFIDSLNFESKVRWYKEIGEDRITYEAKTRFQKEIYSIEFFENGNIKDVEIAISATAIPEMPLLKIKEYLFSKYGNYKIDKTQIQYSGEKQTLLNFLRGNRQNSAGIETRYELVISTRVEGSFKLFEYLFSQKGEYIQSATIIQRRTDIIEY